jgi:3-deoxy-D-manno-octulosonic-acid transferase
VTAGPPGAYRLLLAAVPALSAGLSPFSSAIAAARRGRLASGDRFEEWSRQHRTGAPLVLWHAPSAGEWRQAEPVLHRLRRRHSDWQWALTYTSLSAPAVVDGFAPDVHGFLPWDTPEASGALMRALRPSLVVFTRLDLWPELAFQAARQGADLALIGATVRPGSGRLRWPARSVLRPAYALLARAAAVSADDVERLGRLGVPADRLAVLGDPRADAVLERIAGHASERSLDPLLVAGSTWPEDDRVLLAAFARVRGRRPRARLLLAPHVTPTGTLDRIAALAREFGLPPPQPHAGPDAGAPIRVIETVGQLAQEYGRGWLAYVGGGFGRSGLHSVLEPAAWGLPVVVGPHAEESRDAGLLREAGALVSLTGRDPVSRLAECWEGWVEDPVRCQAAGAAARRVVEQGRGAADRTASLLAELAKAPWGRA